MTSADVIFSIDQARKAQDGWGFIDAAIETSAPTAKYTVVIKTKYPWAPLRRRHRALRQRDRAEELRRQDQEGQFYNAPVGTGPFMWDHWTQGKELKFVKNPHYWQKGKPYLDSVTWTYVPDDNTRLLQLKGGQAQIDEFPPLSQVKPLKSTSGMTMTLFPSTRTDYMIFNEHIKPFQDVHVRRAISYAIDRKALVKAMLFGNGTPANSFLPPQVPYYDPRRPGLQYNMAKAKAELAKSNVPERLHHRRSMVGRRLADAATIAQVLQAALKPLGINVNILKKVDPNAGQPTGSRRSTRHEPLVLDDGHRRPGRARVVRGRPRRRAPTRSRPYYNNPQVDQAAHQAASASSTRRSARRSTPRCRRSRAQDAFMAFLYYSPFRYAVLEQGAGLPGLPDRQLPHGGRLAAPSSRSRA